MKTYSPKPQDVERKWYVIDAEGEILGRLAARVANIIRGKHKPMWAPHADVGDYVVIINADKVRLTGRKADTKVYYSHSGYPGGLKTTPFRRLQSKRPEFIVREAVRGMLPHNRLGRAVLKHVKIYASSTHPHEAQQPEKLTL
ncbi:50S ribosomal protein L13 [candidate division KSB1 bacterium]|nr:50S ribosomal protein L13 [candidate division KSB1 bacterium]RQW01479.1 MAG: 50S ribosomal protein L13 [candidate division KSB1 bacterium]